MKNKLNLITLILSILFSFTFINLVWADYATHVDVKISYPCAQGQNPCHTDHAVVRNSPDAGDVVNVYITLLDMSGYPATACPGGELFNDCEISVTSELGTIITPKMFLSATNTVAFDSPPGPSTRASVDYTNAQLDAPVAVDTITVSLHQYPDINDTARVTLTDSFSLVIEKPTQEANALIVFQEGPQHQGGVQIPPSLGGESIIRVTTNGKMNGIDRTVRITVNLPFELRSLKGTPLPIPFIDTITADTNDDPIDIRLVISTPECDMMTFRAEEVTGELTLAALSRVFQCELLCEVNITPNNPSIIPGDVLQFTATTYCDGSIEGEYTWEIFETTCTSGGGSIDQTGLYTAPNEGCADIIMVTDTANGNISAIVPIILNGCTPTVAINPSNAIILPGHSLTFTAQTICDGVVQTATSYTWEVSEGTCTESSIDPDTGVYTAGADDGPCQDTIMVTDTANGGITDQAVVIVTYCLPPVVISGPIVLGPPCPASAIYTAETFWCDGLPLPGTYSWELDGEPAGTGDSIEITCINEGTKTLLVTDTANGNLTDSRTITCACYSPPDPPSPWIRASFTGCGTPFIPWFGVVQIQGFFTNFGRLSIVEYPSTPRF